MELLPTLGRRCGGDDREALRPTQIALFCRQTNCARSNQNVSAPLAEKQFSINRSRRHPSAGRAAVQPPKITRRKRCKANPKYTAPMTAVARISGQTIEKSAPR